MRQVRYVGVDYGEKRIGLARADDELMLAIPFRAFLIEDDISIEYEYLATLLKSEADVLVIGLPLTSRGEEGPMAKKVKEFAADIACRTDLPVHFQDERFSTRANEGLLQGVPREERLKLVDALAAAGILQTWLDKQKARREQPG